MEQQKINWGLFKPLEEKLKGAPTAITAVNHNRLLLEEIMLLKVLGDNVLLLISTHHQIFKKKWGMQGFGKHAVRVRPIGSYATTNIQQKTNIFHLPFGHRFKLLEISSFLYSQSGVVKTVDILWDVEWETIWSSDISLLSRRFKNGIISF